MELVSPDSGEETTFDCDPNKLREFRKNRYGSGLYIHVVAQEKGTYMDDFSDESVISIAAQVRELLNSQLNLKISDTPKTLRP